MAAKLRASGNYEITELRVARPSIVCTEGTEKMLSFTAVVPR